jgi:hypothetical protein
VGVSEGRLRYVEVSLKEPFVLSFFALDDEGSGWTLEHRVALSKLWADGGYPWLPLKQGKTPQIALLHPLNAGVVYLKVDRHIVVVDMNMREVIGSYLYKTNFDCMPCVLPPWLGSCRIPSAGITSFNSIARLHTSVFVSVLDTQMHDQVALWIIFHKICYVYLSVSNLGCEQNCKFWLL